MAVELTFLIGAILSQMVLVTLIPEPWAVIALIPSFLVARIGGMSRRSAARLGRAILIVTLPVLLVRSIAAFGISTLISWTDYAAGLLSAAWVAGAYLSYRKSSGVQLALTAVTRAIPFRWGQTVADMVRSALFLLPEVLRRLRDGRDAAGIRFSRGRKRSALPRLVAIVRATFVSLSTVPQRRAEAMIVRGIIRPPGGSRE